ncbi:hypothetical protein KEJ21_00685 [Candidatus Bathyarchaeota archaeon]|nr:hypothetical protein [Candidatus Bathyarchaeota archaeon]MBS7631619.1 hypothetical protein [Candidatus Bathyarchaeota archaeon]
MKRIVFRAEDSLFPKVMLPGSQLVFYYLGGDDETVHVEETRVIDFEELLLRIDRGESVFITLKPKARGVVSHL